MRRGTALALAAVLALVVIATLAVPILEEDPVPAPQIAKEDAEPAPAAPAPPRPRPEGPAPAAPASSPATVPAPPDDDEEDAEWKAYPADAKGPVVVGVVVKYGEENPECSIALESADDPKREDPSVLEDLPEGRFRLAGFPPGKYRVRAKGDETLAAYSNVLITLDGAVTDAGVIRLRRPGSLAGVVQDRAGEYLSGDVRLFGRHPENLSRTVVARAKAIGRQGFQLPPHETGEFLIAFEGEGGWAVVSGKTDADGLAWCVVAPKPWSSVGTVLARPTAPGRDEARILRTTVEPVEAPDLGNDIAVRSAEGGGPVERLPAGRWKVSVRWSPGGAAEEREFSKTVAVAEGATETVEVSR